MNIHEYQAKELLKGYNVPTVPGFLALSPDEAFNAAEKIGGDVGNCIKWKDINIYRYIQINK